MKWKWKSFSSVQFSSVQLLSRVQLFATPCITARQASLSIINSQSLLKLMSIESVMPSSHITLCRLNHVQLFATPWTIQSMEFSRPEYWNEWPFPSPGELPNPGIEPRSPALQVDSLPAEHKGSPRILEWVAYPFSSRSSLPRNRTGVYSIAGGFFTNWAMRKAPESL